MPMSPSIYGKSNCVARANSVYGFVRVNNDSIIELSEQVTKEELATEFWTLNESITKDKMPRFRLVWLAWLYLESPDMLELD